MKYTSQTSVPWDMPRARYGRVKGFLLGINGADGEHMLLYDKMTTGNDYGRLTLEERKRTCISCQWLSTASESIAYSSRKWSPKCRKLPDSRFTTLYSGCSMVSSIELAAVFTSYKYPNPSSREA